MTEDTVISPSTDLDAVRVRRAGLRAACERLRAALPDRAGSSGPNAAELTVAAADVDRLWQRHIDQTEAPDGVLAQILGDAPRLAPMITRLRADHPEVTRRLRAAADSLAAGPGLLEAADHLRAALAAIDKHVGGGGELIYLAYNVDLGGGE
jgi:hypothetical protein